MEARGPLKETAAWKKLDALYAEQGSSLSIPAMFQADPERFEKFSCRLETPTDGPFLVDFSKVQYCRSTQQNPKSAPNQCGGTFLHLFDTGFGSLQFCGSGRWYLLTFLNFKRTRFQFLLFNVRQK